jgi:hypothetical protein
MITLIYSLYRIDLHTSCKPILRKSVNIRQFQGRSHLRSSYDFHVGITHSKGKLVPVFNKVPCHENVVGMEV